MRQTEWLRLNLELAYGQAAPLVAEAFLNLAIHDMRSPRGRISSDFLLPIDLKEFVWLMGIVRKRFTSEVSPREVRITKEGAAFQGRKDVPLASRLT